MPGAMPGLPIAVAMSAALFTTMSDYTQLHYNMDAWYDSINDAHEHSFPDAFGDSHTPRFCQYIYANLSCIEEFSDDHE